jgi:plasmid maintenance system antidote protein VapI
MAAMPSKTRKRPPMHPGEVLRDEHLKPLSLSAGRRSISFE